MACGTGRAGILEEGGVYVLCERDFLFIPRL